MNAPADLVSFCRTEHPKLVGMLSLYCGDVSLAEELAQETLARACRDWRKVRGMDYPSAWAHRVGINLANGYFRRKAAERRAKQRLLSTGEDSVANRDIAAGIAIREAVSVLPRRQRTALILRYYTDLSYAEIARVMDAPEPTVKSLARRAIARLRDEPGIAELEEAPNAV